MRPQPSCPKRVRIRSVAASLGGFGISSLGIVTALMLLASAHALAAESVVFLLRNGDRLTGTIAFEDPRAVTVDTALGRVIVPTELIVKRGPEPETPAVAPAVPEPVRDPAVAAKTLQELTEAYRSGAISTETYHRRRAELSTGTGTTALASTAPPPVLPPPKAVAAAKPKSEAQWNGELQVGTDLGFGTKDRASLAGRSRLAFRQQRFYSVADYRFAYGEIDGDISTDRMDGSLKADWSLTNPLYLYNLGGASYDHVRLIELQYEEGPGVGFKLLNAPKATFNLEGGTHYYVEEREDETSRMNFYYRLSQAFSWKLATRLSLDERMEWLPQVEEPDRYRLRFEGNMNYGLNAHLSLVMSTLNLYDSEPPMGVENNDLQFRSSLAVKF